MSVCAVCLWCKYVCVVCVCGMSVCGVSVCGVSLCAGAHSELLRSFHLT